MSHLNNMFNTDLWMSKMKYFSHNAFFSNDIIYKDIGRCYY